MFFKFYILIFIKYACILKGTGDQLDSSDNQEKRQERRKKCAVQKMSTLVKVIGIVIYTPSHAPPKYFALF